MAWLDEVRAAKPEYANLPDRELADTLHQRFYSDMDRTEFLERAGVVTALPRVPMEGGDNLPPALVYTDTGEPIQTAPAARGTFERTTEGAKQAFGDRPVGQLPAELGGGRLPGITGAITAGADAALRGLHAAIVGGTGGIADLAELAGMDRTSANKLHRDLKALVDTAMVVTGDGGRIPRAREQVRGAGETTPTPVASTTKTAPAQEKIVSAAIRAGDEIFTGPTHASAAAKATDRGIDVAKLNLNEVDGFVTSTGRYVSRAEAARVANAAEQTSGAVKSLESSIVNYRKGDYQVIDRDQAARVRPDIPAERMDAPYYVIDAENRTFMGFRTLREADDFASGRGRAAEVATPTRPEELDVQAVERLSLAANRADEILAEQPGAVLAREAVDASARAAREAERPPNRAGNINLDRIHAPEDVKAAIKQTADENKDFIDARRGVVTQEETRQTAQLLGMNADDLAKRRVGQAFNAEEMFAARELLVAQATKVRDLARRAEGGSDAEKAAFAQEVTRLVAIQEQVAGATAEAGRALSQFRMLAGATKEEIAAMVEAARTRGLGDDLARAINSLDDPAQVAAFAANAFKATKSDMVYEAWINALLSGPTTHAANVMSNALTSAFGVAESGLASAISKVTGSGISLREPFARVMGTMQGAIEGIAAGWQAYRTEIPTGNASKLEMARPRAIPSANVAGAEIGGKQVRIPGRLLMAEDEFFKAIGFRQEINALSTRQAVNEGLTGRALAERIADLRASPTAEMTDAARKAAEKQTFTNPLGKAGAGLQQLVREVPGLRFIVPFIRTPINIVKYAVDRSPFAPLFKEARENIAGKNGAVARDNQIARIALGSTISGVTAYLASQGHITGGGGGRSQTEGAKRALMRADGWQPYSIKVGDNYYSYSRFEPFGMLMGVAADFVEMHDAMTKDEKANLGVLLAGSVSNNLVSKTWLRGPSEALQAINDSQRYGPRYLQSLFGTVVPTGIAQYARAQDPYIREARTILDAVRARIPGESEKLFVRRDAFGEPIRREGALGPDLISPVYQSAAKNDPTIAEMLRLKVYPGRLPRTINNAELTDAEYDTMTRISGQTARKLLDTLVNMPNWRELPEAVQFDAMNDAIRKARDVARAMTISSSPDLPLRILQGTMKKRHITPAAAQ